MATPPFCESIAKRWRLRYGQYEHVIIPVCVVRAIATSNSYSHIWRWGGWADNPALGKTVDAMTEKINESRQFSIAHDENNNWLVRSDIEPLFCYVCRSEKEAFNLAIDTYKDYYRRFRNVEAKATEPRLINVHIPVRPVLNARAYELEVA